MSRDGWHATPIRGLRVSVVFHFFLQAASRAAPPAARAAENRRLHPESDGRPSETLHPHGPFGPCAGPDAGSLSCCGQAGDSWGPVGLRKRGVAADASSAGAFAEAHFGLAEPLRGDEAKGLRRLLSRRGRYESH